MSEEDRAGMFFIRALVMLFCLGIGAYWAAATLKENIFRACAVTGEITLYGATVKCELVTKEKP